MRKCYCLLMLIMILCIFVGCEPEVPLISSTVDSKVPESSAPDNNLDVQTNSLGLPMLSQERMALIESYGQQSGLLGEKWPTFRDVSAGRDFIRYYGSFVITNGNGIETVYDIIYVPYPEIPVPTRVKLRGEEFYSEYAFGLYAFTLNYPPYEGMIGVRYASFLPLWTFVNPGVEWNREEISDEVIAQAAAIHLKYEAAVEDDKYRDVPVGEEYEKQRVLALGLLCTGTLVDLENQAYTRYYGKFQGIDVFYSSLGMAGIPEGNKTIGNATFVGTGYQLIAQKDNAIYALEDAYALGIITDEILTQIAQTHNQY